LSLDPLAVNSPNFHIVPGASSPSGVRRVLTLDSASIAEALNAALFSSGLIQADVARRLGITNQSVDQYRRSARSNPSVKWLIRYLQVCGAKLVVELPHEPL
jgi:hypothetical protein